LRFELKLYTRLLFAAGLTCLAAPAAATDVCHQPVDLPATLAEGVPLVRLTLGNKEAVLILDTGAESTIVSTNAADRLQLPRNMVYPRRLRGLGGGVVGGAAGCPALP
jgi:hypothetical protein